MYVQAESGDGFAVYAGEQKGTGMQGASQLLSTALKTPKAWPSSREALAASAGTIRVLLPSASLPKAAT